MIKKILAYSILISTIGFNLWLNYPETQILADPNDNIFQYSLVGRTNWIWENYGCPLSFSCLPNLIDHNVPNWAEGYPLPFYYSHLPQITIVSSYNLIVKPLLSFFSYPLSLYQYYNWTKYLLLSLFPISVFIALRIVGFSPILAAFGAFFSAHISTDGLYGIDPPSYLWRGYGLTSQLYAIIFLPLAIAFVYRALSEDRRWNMENSSRRLKIDDRKNIYNLPSIFYRLTPSSIINYPSSNIMLAVFFLTLTTAGHLGVGIIGILSTLPFLFFDIKPRNIFLRIKTLFIIGCGLLFLLSYWIIPILLNNNYHIVSFWDPIWKFNSYGWYEVARQFFSGEIFDWLRFPIITAIVIIGFFVMGVKQKNVAFSLLFVFWMLLYFGRTTWGGLIDLIPGMKDFHQHRFVVGVHIAALFLIPAGLEYLFSLISKIRISLLEFFFAGGTSEGLPSRASPKGERATMRLVCLPNFIRERFEAQSWETRVTGPENKKFGIEAANTNLNIIFYILIFIFTSLLIFFTVKQTVEYASLNNKWIYQANDAYRYDQKNFETMLSKIESTKGRIYAGRPGNWGKDFRLGSSQLYLLLGGIGYDISQFLPETWSPLSENEQNFDERVSEDYDLLNIKYIISGKNHDFAPSAKLEEKYGPFELYKVPTTGWFDVVTSPMFVKTDKTNYINLVHLWWNSYSRRWKMHPIISVEKNPSIPSGMQKVIEMKDEVTYLEGSNAPYPPLKVRGGIGGVKNIFPDFPFVFPEATVSAKIKDEKVIRQTYSANIEVPENCKECMVMFKMSYHPDWQVKVDGLDAPKFAVFPFYLATKANPGTHTVEFTYQPNGLKVILLFGEIIIFIFGIFFTLKKLLRLAR